MVATLRKRERESASHPVLFEQEPDGSWRLAPLATRSWTKAVEAEANKQIDFYARQFRFSAVQADDFRSRAYQKVFVGWTTRQFRFKKAVERTVYRVGLDCLRQEKKRASRLTCLLEDEHEARDEMRAVATLADLETRFPAMMAVARRVAGGDSLAEVAADVGVPPKWLRAELESWRAAMASEI